MAAEPINIYSRRIDPRGVLDLLRSLAPALQLIGPEVCWEKIIITCRRRWPRKPLVLTVFHEPGNYDGPDWPRHIFEMQGWFSRFPETDRKSEVIRLIGTFRFVLAMDFEPDRSRVKDDDRITYVSAVAKHLDGVIFTPTALYDPEGRVLYGTSGNSDPEAAMPRIPRVEEKPNADDGSQSASDPEDVKPQPPSAQRVARRAMVLAAVSARALLEQEDPAEEWVQEQWQQIREWIDALEVGEEVEPDEWKVIQRQPGTLEQRATVNATWRLEGLVVLAWALSRCDLPPYDQLVDPRTLLGSLGILDGEAAQSVLSAATLRPADELEELSNQLFAFHWRVRNFHLHPSVMDFAKFAREAWFGPLDIRPYRLLEGDLALEEYPISKAPPVLLEKALSSAMERHLAINWLTGGGEIYSETDTST